jgi:hypothetical protein
LQLNINGFYYRCIELFPLIKSPTPPEEDLSSSIRLHALPFWDKLREVQVAQPKKFLKKKY